MEIRLYETYLICNGVLISDGVLEADFDVISKKINYEDIYSIDVTSYAKAPCLTICYYMSIPYSGKQLKTIHVLALEDSEECRRMILKRREMRFKYFEQQKMLELEKEEKERQRELDASKFYDDCYRFHIKDDSPVYTLFSEKNRVVLLYLDSAKGMNFLKIDGYEENEDVGVIPYDKIHYYEKAGEIHYISDINGSYSSFGGSLTGATFSKKSALLHGILFGTMGMAAAALMSYKPAQQKEAETHFDLQTEARRIDERNVILNFYSDEKKQYLDIELPHDIYNFLLTYLPQKRYAIVSELEKHAAIMDTSPAPKAIEAPAPAPQLAEPKKLSLDEFKEKVEKLKLMKEAGLLTDGEFAAAKAELMSYV